MGGQQLNPGDGDLNFHAQLFCRLPKEVEHTGDVTRYVGYESVTRTGDHIRFFGIEVNNIRDIPVGMVAWELSDSRWTVWESREGKDVIIWQEDITWQWLDTSHSEVRRPTGEFHAQGPPGWRGRGDTGHREFLISANAYVDLRKNGADDEVHIVEYDPSWPERFVEMACWIRHHLGPNIALRVEHYGSTAIPGMPAKPVIDILVQIPSAAEAKKHVVPRLNSETWEYWWYSDHMIFIKRQELMGQRTHHIHMAPQGHELWKGLAFRDYLGTHPRDAARYAGLKRQLANAHRRDREMYTEAKTEFVTEITSKALKGN